MLLNALISRCASIAALAWSRAAFPSLGEGALAGRARADPDAPSGLADPGALCDQAGDCRSRHDRSGAGLLGGRKIADLAVPWPVDNYEGIAIEREANGQLVAWIISDENGAVT